MSKFHDKYNLKKDTVSFKGVQANIVELPNMLAELLEKNEMKFCRQKMHKILPFVTQGNISLISKIINSVGIERPTLPELTDTLQYMTKEAEQGTNIHKKVAILTRNANLFSKDFVSFNVCKKLLKSDILLSEQHHPLRAFDDAITRIKDMMVAKKSKKDLEMQAKGITEYDYSDIDKFTKNNFEALVLANVIYEQGTFNDLVNNKINTFPKYAKDLLSLDFDDLKVLRIINTQATKETHKPDGSYSEEMLNFDEKFIFLNLYAMNKKLKAEGHSHIDFAKIIPQAFVPNPSSDNFQISIKEIKEAMLPHILKYNGVSDEGVAKYQQMYEDDKKQANTDKSKIWDMNWLHLMCFNNPLLKNIIKHATEDNFQKFIFNDNNIIARKNNNTALEFDRYGIDYKKWLNPNMDVAQQEFVSKTGKHKYNFTINLWNRCPQESLFNGNYTTCCTGIGNVQGESYLNYLTHSAFNTFEIKIDNNKTIGMSRVFMAQINKQPSLIVENIEVNNNIAKHFLYNDKTKQEFREFIFNYIRKYAKSINKYQNVDMPIYFGANYLKIKDITKGLKEPKTYITDGKYTRLLGDFPDEVYVNSIGGVCHPKDNKLRFTLIDITKPVKISVDSNSIDNAPYIQEYEHEELSTTFENSRHK